MKPKLRKFIQENPEILKELGAHFQPATHLSFNEFIDTHARKPILTTYDGVEVYDCKSHVWALSIGWSTNNFQADLADASSLIWKYFSSEESRTLYILQNKPLTSVKEQVEALRSAPNQFAERDYELIEEVLTECAKKKLNQ